MSFMVADVPYPQKLLNDYESVVLDLRPHWWLLVPRLALQLLVLAVALMVLVRVDNSAVQILMGIGVLVALVYFGLRYAEWATTNFVVTTDRVIYRSGVLAKSGIEIPLERINTVVFKQRLFERMLGAALRDRLAVGVRLAERQRHYRQRQRRQQQQEQ